MLCPAMGGLSANLPVLGSRAHEWTEMGALGFAWEQQEVGQGMWSPSCDPRGSGIDQHSGMGGTCCGLQPPRAGLPGGTGMDVLRGREGN